MLVCSVPPRYGHRYRRSFLCPENCGARLHNPGSGVSRGKILCLYWCGGPGVSNGRARVETAGRATALLGLTRQARLTQQSATGATTASCCLGRVWLPGTRPALRPADDICPDRAGLTDHLPARPPPSPVHQQVIYIPSHSPGQAKPNQNCIKPSRPRTVRTVY